MTAMREDFERYFDKQVHGHHQYGGAGDAYFYQSRLPYQRGRGVGQWLKTAWSFVKPILIRGAKEVGNQVLDTGGKILSDFSNPSARRNPMETIKARAKEGLSDYKGRIPKIIQGGQGRRRRRKAAPARRKAAPARRVKRARTTTRGQLGRGLRRAQVKVPRRRTGPGTAYTDIFG